MNRYYSLLRPVAPGSYPKRIEPVEIKNFYDRIYVEEIGMEAWGYIEYPEPLTEQEAEDYDLISDEIREWVGVMAVVYDDGRKKIGIKETRKAVAQPPNNEQRLVNRTVDLVWFDSRKAADAFIEENK